MAGSTIAKLFVELGFKDTNFQSGVSNASKSLGSLQSAGAGLSSMFGGVVTRAFQAATAAATAFGAASAVVGAAFEQEITTVAAVSGATGKELEALTNTARELGSTTTFSATQAANAMQALARAGMETNETIAATGPALALAGAAGEDMSLATETLASTLAQFSMDASESGRVSDVFAQALRSSLFDLGSLREAMKYAGTVGAGFNMTLEETVAAVAQFRDLGLEGSMAGTQFRMAMSAAAAGTQKSGAALAKYNLTQQDINPTVHSFADILRTVGEAGIEADDAIAIFGQRAGANMALLAQQFASGGVKYDELLSKLETSTGTAQSMFEQMTDTVQGQFTIARSAMEELLLSVFDAYATPLKEAITAIGEVIADVAAEFERSSGQIAGQADAVFGDFTNSLRANSDAIAQSFVAAVEAVVQVIATLVRLAPILDEIFAMMVALFAVGKILSFVAVLGQAVTAFATVKAAVISLTATITASTGGLYALAVAIGAVIAGIASLAFQYSEAEQAAKRFADAEARVAGERAKREADALARTQSATTATAEYARQREIELATSGELTDSYARELQALERLDGEQLRAKELSGEVVRVNENGVEVYKSVAMLVEEASNAQLGNAEAADQLSSAVRSLQREYADNAETIDTAEAALADYTETSERYNASIASPLLNAYGGTVEGVTKTIEDLNDQQTDLSDTFDKLEQNIARAQQTLARGEVAAALEDEADRADDAAKALDEYTKSLEAARDARTKLAADVAADVATAFDSEAEAAARALDERIAEIESTFATEIALVKRNADEVRALEAQRDALIADARRAAQEEQRQATEQNLDGLLAAREQFTTKEQQIVEQQRAAELAELSNAFAVERALHEQGSAEYLAVVEREQQAEATLRAQFAAEDRAARANAYDETARAIEALEVQAARSTLNELQQIDVERLQTRAQFANATGEQLAQIDDLYAQRRLATEQRIVEDARALTDAKYAAILSLERQKQAALAQIPAEFGAERLAVEEHFDEQILAAKQKSQKEYEDPPDPGPFAQALGKMRDAGAAAFAGIASAAQSMSSIVSSALGVFDQGVAALENMTGASFDLLGAVADVNDQLEQRAELEEQFAAGEIDADEYAEALADLPETAAEGAAGYVTELISGAAAMIGTLVEAVPVIVESFLAELPALVQKVVDALPVLVDALITAIPVVVQVVADTIPQLVQLVVDKLPDLIQAVVDALPVLIQALNDSIPPLLQALADGIAQILEALPAIIDQLLAALPEIITALFAAIDTIIIALVDAIPKVLQAIIDNLPNILIALLDGLLGLVVTLVEQIPVLVAAVINSIPKLVSAILSAIPSMISSIVAAIPQIITGLIDALPSLLAALVSLIPTLVIAIIEALPQIIVALVTELIPALLKAIPQLVIEFLSMILQFFKDVFTEIGGFIAHPFNKDKRPVTKTFGDTPGAVLVGAQGMDAAFTPGDFVAAARDPMNLLAQAVAAVAGTQYVPGRVALPGGMGGLDAAALGEAFRTRGTSEAIRVTVTAEGRTLDDVLHTATKRGSAPRLSRMVKRATQAGAHVGFDRGRYSPAS